MRLSSAVGAARWYQGKGSGDPEVRVTATLRPPAAGDHALGVLAVGDAVYVAPLHVGTGALADDPAGCAELWRALAAAAATGEELDGDGCRLLARPGPAPPPGLGGPVRAIGADQTNTTVVLGERAVVKCYRRLGDGGARELDRVRALTAAGFDGVPALHGAAELEVAGARHALLLLQAYVPGTWDGFAQADRDLRAGATPGWAPAAGRLVARMHRALGPGRPATRADLDGWRAQAGALVAAAAARAAGAPVREAGAALDAAWVAADRLPPVAPVHGDLHLAQLLFDRGGPVAVIDFEPAPSALPDPPGIAETPARDLAALLRSVDNAGLWTEEQGGPPPAAWIVAARAGVLAGYGADAPDPAILRAFELVQGVHECLYAASVAPFWMGVARHALTTLLEEPCAI